MTSTATLICPKCQGAMRTYERNGILIDQCEECRGIFLDRGELERLIDADTERESHGHEHEHEHHEAHERHDEDRSGKRRSRTSFIQDFLGGGE